MGRGLDDQNFEVRRYGPGHFGQANAGLVLDGTDRLANGAGCHWYKIRELDRKFGVYQSVPELALFVSGVWTVEDWIDTVEDERERSADGGDVVRTIGKRRESVGMGKGHGAVLLSH